LQITRVSTQPMLVPRRQAYGRDPASALGAAAASEHGIVTIETDAGITGHGEICSVFSRRGRLLCREVDQLLGPVLLGQDPRRIAALAGAMDKTLEGGEPAKAGVEMALFDIVGKAFGLPVYQLLGGLVRERIPLSYSIPFGRPEEMAAFARERVAEGFRTVKVKVGRDRKTDVETVRAVREAVGPQIRVRVDANMGWRTPNEAIGTIRAMEPSDPEMIEQPLPGHDLDGLARIRLGVGVPILADESVWTPRDAISVVKRGAADFVNVYVSEAGGLLKAASVFAICEAAGIPCMIGSMPETGIGTAAQIHLGVAMTNLQIDSDTCGVLYHEQDLLETPLRIEQGFAYPPEGPGLGVRLDVDALKHHAIQLGTAG
jgi:L-alanine-DL-glutamate epimerase-like enolase superfamily enzyme